MPRCRIMKLPRLRIEMNVGRGYELVLGIAEENGVHSRQEASGICGIGALRRSRYFHHGGDERRGNTVAGDVSDKKSGLRVVGHDEIVEVSGDGSHRHVTGGNSEVGRVGEPGGQNRQLDPFGYFKFFSDFTELLVPL